MDKKGVLPLEKLIVIILVVAAGMLVFYFTVITTQQTTSIVDRSICRDSLIAKEATVFLESESPIEMACFTRYVDIKYGKYKEKKKQNKITFYVDDKKQLEQIFADEIAGCWWQMGEGTIRPFGGFESTGEVRCVICTEISMDEEVARNFPQLDLNEYMSKNNYKSPESLGVDQNYLDLLKTPSFFPQVFETQVDNKPMHYSIVWASSQTKRLPDGTIDLSADPGTISWYRTGGMALGAGTGCVVGTFIIPGVGTAIGCKLGAVVGTATGYFVGFAGGIIHTIVGDQDFTSEVHLAPYDAVAKYCKRLY